MSSSCVYVNLFSHSPHVAAATRRENAGIKEEKKKVIIQTFLGPYNTPDIYFKNLFCPMEEGGGGDAI